MPIDITEKWRSWEELTGVKRYSQLALACQMGTLIDNLGLANISTHYFELTYRYWYLMVMAVNKHIYGGRSAIDISGKVIDEVFNIAGYKPYGTIVTRDGGLVVPDGNLIFYNERNQYYVAGRNPKIRVDIPQNGRIFWNDGKSLDVKSIFERWVRDNIAFSCYLQYATFAYPMESFDTIYTLFKED